MPRTGRPKSDNSKSIMLRVRIDEEIMKQLNFLSEELEVTRSEIVRNEIEMSYKKIIDISDYDETLILYNVS